MKNQQYDITIPTDREHYDRFYETMALISDRIAMGETERFRFAICVSEAYTNAANHGNHEDPTKQVHLHFEWSDHSVEVTIEDQGAGRVSDIDLVSDLESVPVDKSSGRGVGIIQKYADKFEVEQRAEGGLRVRIGWNRLSELQPNRP